MQTEAGRNSSLRGVTGGSFVSVSAQANRCLLDMQSSTAVGQIVLVPTLISREKALCCEFRIDPGFQE